MVVDVTLDLNPDAQPNQRGQRAVRHRWVELYPDHVDIALGWFLYEDSLLIDHLQVLQGVWLLRVSDGPEEICTKGKTAAINYNPNESTPQIQLTVDRFPQIINTAITELW